MRLDMIMSEMLDSMRIDESLTNLVSTLERLSVHWHDPIRLIIMGEFNAGKSTLINTLLRENVIASGRVPTTAIATYVRYAEEKYIEIVYENGVIERKSIEYMEELTSERNKEGKLQRENIDYVNLYLPNSILKNIVLIDTPGLGALHTRHDEQAFDAYEEADESMWIFKYGSVGRDSEISVLKKLKDDGLYPIGVVNMMDDHKDDDNQPYINYEFGKLSGHVQKLIGVSAIEATEAYETNDQELLEISGFPQLISIIEEIKVDKDSLKEKRFNQSFLKFWKRLNDALNELINSNKYLKSIQQNKNDLYDVKKENAIIMKRLADEESQLNNNFQQLLSSFTKTSHLNQWAKREDFKDLLVAIPELNEWKEFNDLYNKLLKAIQQLKQDAREYKHNILKEFGEKVGFSNLLFTSKRILVKYRLQQTEMRDRQKSINKEIKKINSIHASLQKEKNYIKEKIENYYQILLVENESIVMNRIENQKIELIDTNIMSKKLLLDEMRQWDYLGSLQEQMNQVIQFVPNASLGGAFKNELPHQKRELIVEKEITSLIEEVKSISKKVSEKNDIKIDFKLPSKLKKLEEIPNHFLWNIRPLIIASAATISACAFLLFQEPVNNIATTASEMSIDEEEAIEDDYYGYDYQETTYGDDSLYEELEPITVDNNLSYIGYIDVGSEDIHVYHDSASGYEESMYVLAGYTTWGVYSENDSYYEIQDGFWVKKEDVAHLFTANLQEYVQYEAGGMATIYSNTNEEILVYERANNESSQIGYLGDMGYEVFAFTENGWMQIGEDAWVFYDNQYITLDQATLTSNLNMYSAPILRTEGTTSTFIPIFAENNRESPVIGYLENVSDVDIYELPTSKWVNIGTNAWIEADKYLDIDWNFVVQEHGEPIGTLTVDISALNVREKDYQESNLIGILPKGTTVNVYEVSNSTGWYRVGLEGWVSEDPEYSTITYFYDQQPTGEVAIGVAEVLVSAHVRLNDHLESESQGIIKQGKNVEVYEISSDTGWYRIGYDAWISNSGKVVSYVDYGLGAY